MCDESLTPREYAVLAYLMQRRGEVVSEQELHAAVWGCADLLGTEALRSTIKRLRRKLGDNPQSPRYLATVWGRGYRLEER